MLVLLRGVPCRPCFLNGLSGAFYKQFAVTISAATAISAARVADAVARARRVLLLKGAKRPAGADRARGAARGGRVQPRLRADERGLCAAPRARW